MKSVAMSGSLRANVGKKDAKELRRSGMVPCVLYGGQEQVMFSVDERAFKNLVYTPEVATVDLDLGGGKKHSAILREIQLHPVTDRIIHADFLEVVTGKLVTMDLPVKFEGTSPGVRAGGKLLRKLRKLSVRGPLEKLPASIAINVEKMEIGDTIRVEDMKMDGLEFLDTPSVTIVTVRVTRNVAEEEAKPAAATAAAPAAAGAPAAGAPAAGAKPAAKPAEKKK
jgi:large subunit ribosomal protein L25